MLNSKKTVVVMTKIEDLTNRIQQKFVKIAKIARIKEEDGKSNYLEFCCLMRLQALLVFVSNTKEFTQEQLIDLEIQSNNICGRDKFLFKNMDWSFLDFVPVTGEKDCLNLPISACDVSYENPKIVTAHNTVCSYLDAVIDALNYQAPWIKFTVLTGLQPGKYEVGTQNSLTTVKVEVNKSSKLFYDISDNGTITKFPREVKNAFPNQFVQINFENIIAKTHFLNGEYFDLQQYQGQHLKAETRINWQSVWPCYYGAGPKNALDNPSTRNAFIQSLQKSLDCNSCFNLEAVDGQVLYYFFPFNNQKKQFRSENGIINGSYKGTISDFRTKSMDNYNVPGGNVYGVIRTDQEGIGGIELCVINLNNEEGTVTTPPTTNPSTTPPTTNPDTGTPTAPVITYESVWSVLLCASNQVISYESIWSVLKCNLEESTV